MSAVPVEVTETLDGVVVSLDVADDFRDVVVAVALRGVSTAALFKAWTDGFLKSPLIDGLLVGRGAARVLEPILETVTSSFRFSGLGVLERGNRGEGGGGIPCVDVRTVFPGVPINDRGWKDWILLRPRRGVLSIVDSEVL